MNNTQAQLLASVIRAFTTKNNTPYPGSLPYLINQALGVETYEERLAKDVVAVAGKITTTAKKLIVNRKFKKITKNI